MGKTKDVVLNNNITTNSKVLPLQVDANGSIRYDALILQGHDKDRIVQTKYQDLVPMDVHETDEFRKPSEEEAMQVANRTKDALEKIISGKDRVFK
jgi:SNW domain-containing protein 1